MIRRSDCDDQPGRSQTDPTNASPINFTVVFSEPVIDFTGTDVTLAGTAGATTAMSPAADHLQCGGQRHDHAGTVIASIAAGVAHDAAGNVNTASTSTDNTVTFDNTGRR